MDKMMHAKEQDRKHVSDALERWFIRNFGDLPMNDPMYQRVLQAKDDARHVFGLEPLYKGDLNDSQ